jgi:G:T/U-mismatch repair DNA glycosylase
LTKPINILDKTERPLAYKALFEELFPDAHRKAQAAQQASAMPAILDAAKAVGTIHAVEEAGTHDEAQSRELIKEVTDHAVALLKNSTGDMSNRVNAISTAANAVQTLQRVDPATGRRTTETITRRGGISGNDAQTLRNIQQTCAQIVSAASDLATDMGNPDAFKEIAANADNVRQRATAVLNGDSGRGP